MVIGVYFAFRPGRRVELFGPERNQRGLLFRFEDFPGYSSRGSVDAATGHLATPDQGATGDIIEIDKSLALEEAFPHIAHMIFNDRLVLGVNRPRRVGQKASKGGVLDKSSVEARRVEIALINTSFHSVHDNASWTTAEKFPGAFEAVDDRGQILPENGDHAAEPTVGERQDKSMDDPRSRAAQFLQQPELPEIRFGHFAGQALGRRTVIEEAEPKPHHFRANRCKAL